MKNFSGDGVVLSRAWVVILISLNVYAAEPVPHGTTFCAAQMMALSRFQKKNPGQILFSIRDLKFHLERTFAHSPKIYGDIFDAAFKPDPQVHPNYSPVAIQGPSPEDFEFNGKLAKTIGRVSQLEADMTKGRKITTLAFEVRGADNILEMLESVAQKGFDLERKQLQASGRKLSFWTPKNKAKAMKAGADTVLSAVVVAAGIYGVVTHPASIEAVFSTLLFTVPFILHSSLRQATQFVYYGLINPEEISKLENQSSYRAGFPLRYMRKIFEELVGDGGHDRFIYSSWDFRTTEKFANSLMATGDPNPEFEKHLAEATARMRAEEKGDASDWFVFNDSFLYYDTRTKEPVWALTSRIAPQVSPPIGGKKIKVNKEILQVSTEGALAPAGAFR